MSYYILVHRETQRIMPQMKGSYTYWEPKLDMRKKTPRLFPTLRGAQNARSWWARGWAKQQVSIYGRPDRIIHNADHLIPDNVKNRKITDLQIRKIKLQICEEIY